MVETPAAVTLSDKLSGKSSFFSIGTNDLTQYTLAADRLNPKVEKVYSHFHPAVLKGVQTVVENAKAKGIPVGMCGEAAGAPGLIPLYLAFGLDEWSVNPASVLAVRKEISTWSLSRAKEVAQGALAQDTTAQLQKYLEGALTQSRS
jgi:phosphotransferase system enzyme I (PtsI)